MESPRLEYYESLFRSKAFFIEEYKKEPNEDFDKIFNLGWNEAEKKYKGDQI